MAAGATPRLRLRISVEAAPAYELILSLSVAASAGRPVRAAWLDKASGLAGPDLIEQARALCGGCDMVWTHLLSVAYESAARHDLDAFVDRLAGVPPHELRLRLLGYYVRWFRRATPAPVIAAAAAGDARARRTLLETSYPDDAEWQSGLRAVLSTGPLEGKRRVLSVVRRWRDRVFEPLLREPFMAELERDTRLRRGAVRRDGTGALAAVTGGWDYIPEPGISHLLVIPSIAIAPTVHVLDHHQVKLVCYPVEPRPGGDGAGPPDSLVRTMQSLGDDRRLRILRLLHNDELSATELATLLDIGLTTLVHHLDQLRDAGLVVSSGDRPKRYRAAPGAEAEMSRALAAYLGGSAG
jgi:DNA-binding transcriptional ArsR family regulator